MVLCLRGMTWPFPRFVQIRLVCLRVPCKHTFRFLRVTQLPRRSCTPTSCLCEDSRFCYTTSDTQLPLARYHLVLLKSLRQPKCYALLVQTNYCYLLRALSVSKQLVSIGEHGLTSQCNLMNCEDSFRPMLVRASVVSITRQAVSSIMRMNSRFRRE